MRTRTAALISKPSRAELLQHPTSIEAQRTDRHDHSTDPVIHLATSRRAGVPLGGPRKRAFDVVFASLIITLAAPLLLLVGLAVRASGKGPVIYAHKRVGFNGRAFDCYKFRSMAANGDALLAQYLSANPEAAQEWAQNRKLKKDPRVTLIGKLLRRTSLDELPQLFNVMRGEMSLVGPRPVVAEELPRYGAFGAAYLSARPGITGLWQVNGRSTTTYQRRTELDAAYVSNWRLREDIKIIIRTIPELASFSRAF